MTDKIKVWDPAVRLFHWGLVVSYAISYWYSDDDVRLHANAGYVVFSLLLFRILWGFIGSRFARFREFVHGPKKTFNYLRSLFLNKAPCYIGHNPAGAWMIFLLIMCLFLTSWSGLMIYAQEGKGPLAILELRWLSGDSKFDKNQDMSAQNYDANHAEQSSIIRDRSQEPIYALHDFFASFSLLLVVIHLSGVLVASRLHRENLVKAMITGSKPQEID